MNRIGKILFILAICVSGTYAQAIDNITRRCKAPNNSVFGKVLVTAIGDIVHTPCPARASIFTGNVDFTGATIVGGFVSGSGTLNFIPRWSGATALTNTPFSWDATSYVFENTALNAEFRLELTPSVAGGSFRVGDFTVTPTDFLTINQASGISLLQGSNSVRLHSLSQVLVGDTSGSGNGMRVDISDGAQTASIGDTSQQLNGTALTINDATQTFDFRNDTNNAGVFDLDHILNYQYFRTITAAGTTGDRTIDRPAGTVNFAIGATQITVTNSISTTSSIILATARVNDATCSVKSVTAGAGSFVIDMTAACTAETSVGFLVIN